MGMRLIIICVLLSCAGISNGQRQVTDLDKTSHLTMLKEGVLLVRISSQEKKIAAMSERGQKRQVETLKREIKLQNELIVKAFNTHYLFSKVYFIRPQDTKPILKNELKNLKDVSTGQKLDLSAFENIYVTDYGYGNPADGFERYNRKGFQIYHLEDGEVKHLGRDLFYAGIKRGIFAPAFGKSLQKTIRKFNKRLSSGKKYF